MNKIGDFSILLINGTKYFFNAPLENETHPLSELLTYGSWVFVDVNGINVSVDMSLHPLEFDHVDGDVELLGSDIACFSIFGSDGIVDFDTFDDLFDGFDEVYE